MFKLKYTQKLGLIISFATTLVILLSFGTFILLFYNISTSQVRKSLLYEATEVIENYIKYENNQLIIVNREDLVTDVLRDQLSIMILDINGKALDYFGLFTKENSQTIFNDYGKFQENIKQSIQEDRIIFTSLIGRENRNAHVLLISPLSSFGKNVGAIAIVSPMENINLILKNSILLVIAILPLSIISIYFVGQSLGKGALMPVRQLDSMIENINFANLNSNITPTGHSDDDVYKLTLEFNNMIERLKEGIEKQKSFISNSSHELRTPLARLQTSVDLIKGNSELKKDISDEVRSISETLTRLSILSKIGKKENNIKNINLRKYINEYLKQNKSSRNVKNLVKEDLFLKIDKLDLKIILDNLISNALKYSDTDIEITSTEKSFVVSDKGIGIPKTELSMITAPFFRSSLSVRKGIDGTGLGLSIVKEICNQYAYKLNIKSRVGHGTDIEIVFA